jgi:hypothetical protein
MEAVWRARRRLFDLAFEKNGCCPVSEMHPQRIVVGWLGAGASSQDGARTPMRGLEVDLGAAREAPDMAAQGRARRAD